MKCSLADPKPGYQGLTALWLKRTWYIIRPYGLLSPFLYYHTSPHPSIFFHRPRGLYAKPSKLFVLYSHTYKVVLFWCSRYIYFFVSGVFFVCPDLLFCQKFCFIWRSGDLYSYCFTSFSHLNLISIFCTVAHSEKSEQSNSHEFTDISELSPPELCSLQSGFLPLASFFFNSCRSACFLFLLAVSSSTGIFLQL